MQDALQVTKDLADNCRSKGTAFRLGVCVFPLHLFFPRGKPNFNYTEPGRFSFMFTKCVTEIVVSYNICIISTYCNHS